MGESDGWRGKVKNDQEKKEQNTGQGSFEKRRPWLSFESFEILLRINLNVQVQVLLYIESTEYQWMYILFKILDGQEN